MRTSGIVGRRARSLGLIGVLGFVLMGTSGCNIERVAECTVHAIPPYVIEPFIGHPMVHVEGLIDCPQQSLASGTITVQIASKVPPDGHWEATGTLAQPFWINGGASFDANAGRAENFATVVWVDFSTTSGRHIKQVFSDLVCPYCV